MNANGHLDAATIMGQIDSAATALDVAGKELGAAIQDLSTAERAYEEAVQKELIAIHHDSREAGERPPAEDLRRAMAHSRIDRAVYGAYLEKRARVDALRAYVRALENSTSARQSLLSTLRAELEVTV